MLRILGKGDTAADKRLTIAQLDKSANVFIIHIYDNIDQSDLQKQVCLYFSCFYVLSISLCLIIRWQNGSA